MALTAGEVPKAEPQTLFPPEIVSAGLHHAAWFDLWGARKTERRTAQRLRDFESELVHCKPNKADILDLKPNCHGMGISFP